MKGHRRTLAVTLLGALALAAPACGGGTGSELGGLRSDLDRCAARQQAPRCYAPSPLRRTYAVQPLLDAGADGRGRTVVIVADASPSLRHDVQLYDRLVGLPDPHLTVLHPFGATTTDRVSEDVLDVETVHTLAPGASLVVVDAHTSTPTPSAAAADQIDGTAYLRATRFAVEHDHGDVVSQSFGTGETCLSPSALAAMHQVFQLARDRHITALASAGDQGSVGRNCASGTSRGVNVPAADPLVTAVGGTKLTAARNGDYQGEVAWNESRPQAGARMATGGGYSGAFPRPAFQAGPPAPGARAIPDAAYDADHDTGVPTVRTVSGRTQIVIGGGTSLGAPSWAAIAALADQRAGRRLGFLNAALYRLARSSGYAQAFRDVTRGDNTVRVRQGGQVVTVTGYPAGPGWDAVTGWGSPLASGLADLLPRYQQPDDGAGV